MENNNYSIHCLFRDCLRSVKLYSDFEKFCFFCAKQYQKENDIKDLEFYIFNKDEKIIIKNKDDYNNFIINNDDDVVINFDYKKIKRKNKFMNNETEELNNRLNELYKKMNEQKEDLENLKKKNLEFEKKNMKLEKEFNEFQNQNNLVLSNIKKEILNFQNLFDSKLNQNEYNINKTQDFENEKPITRKTITDDGNNYKMRKIPLKDNEILKRKNIEDKENEIKRNEKSESNEDYINEDDYITSKEIRKNNSIKNSHEDFVNYNNSKNNNLVLNKNFENNENEEYKNDFNIKSDYNDYESNFNKSNNYLSCEFIIDEKILIKLRSQCQGKKDTIKYDIKLKNNGNIPIPKNSKIKSNIKKVEADLLIKDTIVNNGEEIEPNKIINVCLYIFFKDPNNIKEGLNYLYFILYNDNYGKIGKEEVIKIQIKDETKNLEEDYDTYNNNEKDDYFIYNVEENEINTSVAIPSRILKKNN